MRRLCQLSIALLLVLSLASCGKGSTGERWTAERANAWYAELPWMAGCDYITSDAINQIEMWSAETYNAAQIDKEMGWAEELGLNTMRVYLSSVVYEKDADGMKQRMDNFLSICQKHGVRPLFCIFDDCWAAESSYGKQPEPKPGVHNSGWVQDPSAAMRKDTAKLYALMECYVKDLLKTFGQDERVLLWDLWNEPGNSDYFESTLPLLKKVYGWAREANPSQPLTMGIWNFDDRFLELNAFQLEHSDVISYHNYDNLASHEQEVKYLKLLNRPLVCTEYMARRRGSTFQSIMPMLKKNKVVAINWGFVSGKTNTIFAWDDPQPDVKEPELWFHDIIRQDGSPFSEEEIACIKQVNGVAEKDPQ